MTKKPDSEGRPGSIQPWDREVPWGAVSRSEALAMLDSSRVLGSSQRDNFLRIFQKYGKFSRDNLSVHEKFATVLKKAQYRCSVTQEKSVRETSHPWQVTVEVHWDTKGEPSETVAIMVFSTKDGIIAQQLSDIFEGKKKK